MRDALAAGPSLLSQGRIDITVDEEVFFGSTIPRVHPRTAVGYTGSGTLIILVVDGRQVASRGVDLVELATLMREFHAGRQRCPAESTDRGYLPAGGHVRAGRCR